MCIWSVEEHVCLWSVEEHVCIWSVGEHVCIWSVGEHVCIWSVGEHVCRVLCRERHAISSSREMCTCGRHLSLSFIFVPVE